jgi:hypothetical protein
MMMDFFTERQIFILISSKEKDNKTTYYSTVNKQKVDESFERIVVVENAILKAIEIYETKTK